MTAAGTSTTASARRIPLIEGVISDFRTPGECNGADVRHWLLQHRPALASRIIFITGDTASDQTIAELAQSGMPFFEKPFRVQQLMNAVEKTIGKA